MWVLGGMCYWVTQRSIEIRKYLRFFCSVAQVSCPEILEKCKFIYIPRKPASIFFTPLFHLISRQAQGIKFCEKILLAAHILIISGFEGPKIDNVSSNCKLCLEFNCKLACFMPYHPHWAAHERQVSSFALRPDVVSSLPMPSGLDEPYEPYTLCMQCTYTIFDRLFKSSVRDLMSINPSNSSGPQRTLRTIDTPMGASVPIRLNTQFSHILRFYHVTCQLGVLVHVLYFCKDYDSNIPRTPAQPQKVHHGCHRYVSIVAQLDYLLYFNIPRTEKYSIAMCYRYVREAKKCKIQGNFLNQ